MRLYTSFKSYYFYSCYLKAIKNKKDKFKIPLKDYSRIINMAHELISKGMIEDKFIFKPPYLHCKFRVKKYKQPIKLDENGKIIKSNLPVNWKETNEYWKKNPIAKEKKILIYHLNDHSDGFRYRFSKNRRSNDNKNLAYYSFLPTRKNNRMLAAFVLNPYNNIEFYE